MDKTHIFMFSELNLRKCDSAAIPFLFTSFVLFFFLFCLLLVLSLFFLLFASLLYCHLWITRPNQHTRNAKRARGPPTWGENASSVARAPTQGFPPVQHARRERFSLPSQWLTARYFTAWPSTSDSG